MLYVFIGCLAFGAFYSIVSLVLGGHGFDHSVDHGGGFDVQHGGFDVQHGGIDVQHGGIANVDHGGDSADSPSLFNPLVIASAITAFGAVGLAAMKGFGMSGLLSTIVALAFAGAIGAAIFFGIVKFMYGSQSNSIFSLNDLIDIEAEVLTPIPKAGLGEIAYTQNGIRYTLSARSKEGESVHRGVTVVIREIAGNVAIVQQKLTLEDIDLNNERGHTCLDPLWRGMSPESNAEHEKGENEKPRSDAGNN